MGFEAHDEALGLPDPMQPTPEPMAGQLVYVATIAECIDPNTPDLGACNSLNGADQLVVDGNDGTTDSSWQSYVRFDLDDAFDGMTVVGVKLVMTATDDDKANGPDSGDVWQVTAFDRTMLGSQPPAKVGTAPLASSRGSVDEGDIVQWGLPPTFATPGASLHLGVITTDNSGGVNYWNLLGREPPRIEIDVE